VRVVFDTNIYVSAFVLPGSSADRAMQRIFDGHDTLLISKPIFDELLTTLARKFSRDANALSRTALYRHGSLCDRIAGPFESVRI